MRYIWIGSLMCLLATGWLSCKKMLDVDATRAVTEENMWKTKNDAWAGSFACYSLLRAAMANENAYWAYGDMRGGDFTVTKRGDLQALRSSNLTSNYPAMDAWRDWRRFYAVIAQCNLALSKLPGITEQDNRYPRSEMKLDMAQVRFIRAFTYFYIVRVWGDVPLITAPFEGEFMASTREDWNKVLDFAMGEVLAAAKDLPWKFDGTNPEQQGTYRGQGGSHWQSILATRGACYDLAAHIAAWKKDYVNALNYINIILDNKARNSYEYVTDNNMLVAPSGTSGSTFRGRTNWNIFQLDFNIDHAEISTTGQLEYWTLRSPDVPKAEAEIYVTKDSILNIYSSASDVRASIFFTDMTSVQPMFYKLRMLASEVRNPPLRLFNAAIVVFRFEELSLLRAECYARTKNLPAARTELNTLRARRYIEEVPATATEGELLDLILAERRRELIGEGWRWFDLMSFGKVPAYSKLSATDVQNGGAYWPLAKNTLSLNPQLTQYSYWK